MYSSNVKEKNPMYLDKIILGEKNQLGKPSREMSDKLAGTELLHKQNGGSKRSCSAY